MATKLAPNSLWLLRFLKERMEHTKGGGYCNHLPMPPDAPAGLSMTTLRGLEKRGLAEEFITGCFRPTQAGLNFLEKENEK